MTEITGNEHRLHYVTELLRELMRDPKHSLHLNELGEAILILELEIVAETK
jgi:hypothetical protein